MSDYEITVEGVLGSLFSLTFTLVLALASIMLTVY